MNEIIGNLNKDFTSDIISFENNDKFFKVIAKEKIKFDEDEVQKCINQLDYLFEEYYKLYNSYNLTIQVHFDLHNLSSFESYKFAKKLYPYFKSKTEMTEQFVTKTYVITNNYLIRVVVNNLLKLQKLNRPVKLIKSSNEITDFESENGNNHSDENDYDENDMNLNVSDENSTEESPYDLD